MKTLKHIQILVSVAALMLGYDRGDDIPFVKGTTYGYLVCPVKE